MTAANHQTDRHWYKNLSTVAAKQKVLICTFLPGSVCQNSKNSSAGYICTACIFNNDYCSTYHPIKFKIFVTCTMPAGTGSSCTSAKILIMHLKTNCKNCTHNSALSQKTLLTTSPLHEYRCFPSTHLVILCIDAHNPFSTED